MGRHSAPDDEDDLAPSAVATLPATLRAPVAEPEPDAAGPEAAGPEAAGPEPAATPRRRGRHAAPDDDTDERADEPVDEPADERADESNAPPPTTDASAPEPPRDEEPTGATRTRRESSTRADLRLLRTDAALRARCIAAVVVPFALYTVVLVVLGLTGKYLLFLAAPAIVAGTTVGALLDLAHRALVRAQAEPEVEAPPATADESEPDLTRRSDAA